MTADGAGRTPLDVDADADAAAGGGHVPGRRDVPGEGQAPGEGHEPMEGYAAARLRLLHEETRPGPSRRTGLAALTDRWLAGLFHRGAREAGTGAALVAVGGYGRGELSPRSDLDLLLLHDGSAGARAVAALADHLWYPVWDLGLALDHSVRTPTEARKTAADDLKVQLGLLEARHVAGDSALTAGLRAAVLADWRNQAAERLPELREMCRERAHRHGELRFLLEPDLKEAGGGLRDLTALRAVAASWLADAPREGLEDARRTLLDVRDALHLATGRATDRLTLQEQDQVAADLGLLDADALLRQVYEAARTVSYAGDVTWREVGRVLKARAARPRLRGLLGGRGGRAAGGRAPGETGERRPLAEGVVEQDGEVVLARAARPDRDPVLPLRAAAAAAQAGLPLSRHAARRMASAGARHGAGQERGPGGGRQGAGPGGRHQGPGQEHGPGGAAGTGRPAPAALPVPWPAEARDALVTLLGAGRSTVQVWEALEAEGLITRLLPDWERVRCRPQRNPVHRWTVDRHLVETAVRASALTRRVGRPDLLLVAALLHDIGKGWPGDHSAAGEVIARDVASRIGFDRADADVLATLVRHHLLLVRAATRRDLEDPATIEGVAEAVRSHGTLELLHALTESDALATGPAAWSAWRGSLVADLVKRVAAVLAGEPADDQSVATEPTAEQERLAVEALRTGGPVLALHAPTGAADDAQRGGSGEGPGSEPVGVELVIAVPDQPGVLPAAAGVLALHRLTVRAADLRAITPPAGLAAQLPEGLAAPLSEGRAVTPPDGLAAAVPQEPGATLPESLGYTTTTGAGPSRDPGSVRDVLLLSWRVAAEYGSLPQTARLRSDLVRALHGSLDIASRLAEREAAYPRRRGLDAPPPRVTVAPAGSRLATVIEVRAQDAPGLLHRIGRALDGAAVRVRSAHISTLGANAVDAFYVTDDAGAPLVPADAAEVARGVEKALR